jgi:hypothetical protein
MEIGFIDEEIKKRKSSPKTARFALAGIILLLSLLIARSEKKSEE